MKRQMIVCFALALIALTAFPGASSQDPEGDRALRSRIEERYDIVPLTDGIGLTPKNRERQNVRLIEVSNGVIAVNGVAVTGRELRERVGDDADLILRVSYLSAGQRRELFAEPGSTVAPRSDRRPREGAPAASGRIRRSGGERVRIFGDVVVDEDEEIARQVVAVLGSVRVNGEVGEQVVAVLGSVDVGPKAIIRGDVVSIGGRVRRAPGAQLRGAVTEVSIGDPGFRLHFAPWLGPRAMGEFGFEFPRLLGSTFRMLLLTLFAGIALVMARGSVERSAERVTDNAAKSMFVGLAAGLLVVPLFVLTAVVLVLTLIGIPLLLLLPFAGIMLLLYAVVGFTGTAYAVGQAARRRFGTPGRAGFIDICFGLLIILSPLLLGRLLAVAGWPSPLVMLLIVAGTVFEFVAWTAGFGAVVMNLFSRWRARRIARTTAPVPAA